MSREVMQQALEAWQTSAYGTVQHHKAMLVAMTEVGKAMLAQPEQNLTCKSTQARLATAWGYAKAPPVEERNFCPRCGKRLASGFVELSIHTCTPPKETK